MVPANFQSEQWLAAARNALSLRLLVTMASTVLTVVLLYGLLGLNASESLAGMLSRFIGGTASLLVMLFGLTALAHQIHCQQRELPVPNSIEAARYAADKVRALLMIPVWGVGALLALFVAELLLVALGNFPGLGMVWLALIAVPLLLLNTLVAVALILALFNIAASVAVFEADAETLKNHLWDLLLTRMPELLVYNLGGVMVTVFVAVLLLSPLWLGGEFTFGLMQYAAHEEVARMVDATGFWGGIAHLVGLLMAGLLLAAIVSVPGVTITHMTVLVHMELAQDASAEESVDDSEHFAEVEAAGEVLVEKPDDVATDTPADKTVDASANEAEVSEPVAEPEDAPAKKPTRRSRKKVAEKKEGAEGNESA